MNVRRASKRAVQAALALIAAFVLILGCLVILPQPFGYSTYAVMSPSMAPSVPLGSLAVINEHVGADEIEAGDVVAFKQGEADESVCVHRAESIDGKGGLIETKGDANDTPDLRLVPFEDVTGKVCATVPLAGFAIKWLESHRAAFLGVAAALILASASLSLASPTHCKRNPKKGTECPNKPQQSPNEA